MQHDLKINVSKIMVVLFERGNNDQKKLPTNTYEGNYKVLGSWEDGMSPTWRNFTVKEFQVSQNNLHRENKHQRKIVRF